LGPTACRMLITLGAAEKISSRPDRQFVADFSWKRHVTVLTKLRKRQASAAHGAVPDRRNQQASSVLGRPRTPCSSAHKIGASDRDEKRARILRCGQLPADAGWKVRTAAQSCFQPAWAIGVRQSRPSIVQECWQWRCREKCLAPGQFSKGYRRTRGRSRTNPENPRVAVEGLIRKLSLPIKAGPREYRLSSHESAPSLEQCAKRPVPLGKRRLRRPEPVSVR